MKNDKLKIELADRSGSLPCIDFEDEVAGYHFGSDVFKPYLVWIGKQLLAKKIRQVWQWHWVTDKIFVKVVTCDYLFNLDIRKGTWPVR